MFSKVGEKRKGWFITKRIGIKEEVSEVNILKNTKIIKWKFSFRSLVFDVILNLFKSESLGINYKKV